MTAPAHLELSRAERRTVLDILGATLPPGAAVWVFGSRATGRARPCSDLDLAVDCGRRLTLDELAILGEAFSDSDLPYQVDVLDWQATDAAFRRLIAGERLPLADDSRRAISTQTRII